MVELSGLHILLTYRCLLECDHCFVWGSPKQTGVFTRSALETVFEQAQAVPSLRTIYFEGGEPFLYYPLLVGAVNSAAGRGFEVGVVTNGYWGTCVADALDWLRPMAGSLTDVSVSTDRLHFDRVVSSESRAIEAACRQLEIPMSTITYALPQGSPSAEPVEGAEIMFRGRAVPSFAGQVPHRPWHTFDECPHEDLADPQRVHLDPFGNLHLCQGLIMGNLFERPLAEILGQYRPSDDPIVGPLHAGGPAELVRSLDLPHDPAYADACHLCYSARDQLRLRFPQILTPGQMYGEGLT